MMFRIRKCIRFASGKVLILKSMLKSIVGFRMVEEKKHLGRCFDCNGITELVELDVKKGTKIMQCTTCGLFHFYKKDFLGRWKLLKVSKECGSREPAK
ncbi:MAG: hypothetical protein ACP5IM_02980 [Candidatus Bathyarchaeia archaeon]